MGGLGIAPSGNIGDSAAIFEPVHGSAPDIAGKGIANPAACILSAAMMLEFLGESDWARKLENAVDQAWASGKYTADLSGDLSTAGFTSEIIERIRV